ncbi:glycerate kinase type-2 family protein [Roseobacteraceae bacterium S113]
MSMNDTELLVGAFEAAVAAADAEKAIAPLLPAPPAGRTVVIGAGKGAAQMAQAFERLWPAAYEGVVVTRYGYGAQCEKIEVLEASHPVPDANGLAASAALFAAVEGLTEDDLVIALVCGGGSALLPAPAEGLDLADEQGLNEALLASGAPIGVMNAIRNCASRIKGGRLAAAAHPARVVSLVVSDVPGDDPAQVASGPTVPDVRGLEQARALIAAHKIAVPPKVAAALVAPPYADDAVFAKNEVHVVASARLSLEAAARYLEAQGLPAVILSDAIEGEARDIGLMHAAIAREVITRGRPFKAPVAILSGGETTVTLTSSGGRGGRNTEFLLAAALQMEGLDGVTALAADTDGIDGSEDNAGAFADGGSTARMRAAGRDPAAMLAQHDAWGAFDAAGDIFAPGPTGTNVNDFRAFVIR